MKRNREREKYSHIDSGIVNIETFINRSGSEEMFLKMAGMSMRQIKRDYWQEIKNREWSSELFSSNSNGLPGKFHQAYRE